LLSPKLILYLRDARRRVTRISPNTTDPGLVPSARLLTRIWIIASIAAASLLPIGPSRAEQYAVDGFALGQSVVPGNANYRSYACKRSQQFADALDCNRTRRGKVGNSTVTISTTLVHGEDGVVFYATMNVPPVAMTRAAVNSEINELSRAIGAKPGAVDSQEPGSDEVAAVVTATWGGIKFEDVVGEDLDTLRAGGNLRLGLPLAPLDDIKTAAANFMSISRMSGSAGYIYIATNPPEAPFSKNVSDAGRIKQQGFIDQSLVLPFNTGFACFSCSCSTPRSNRLGIGIRRVA
jgi:hypothetical protein